jgi:hypothetical protein
MGVRAVLAALLKLARSKGKAKGLGLESTLQCYNGLEAIHQQAKTRDPVAFAELLALAMIANAMLAEIAAGRTDCSPSAPRLPNSASLPNLGRTSRQKETNHEHTIYHYICGRWCYALSQCCHRAAFHRRAGGIAKLLQRFNPYSAQSRSAERLWRRARTVGVTSSRVQH